MEDTVGPTPPPVETPTGPPTRSMRMPRLGSTAWIALGITAVVFVATVIVLLAGNQAQASYPADSPEAALQGYLTAWYDDDYDTAYGFFSTVALLLSTLVPKQPEINRQPEHEDQAVDNSQAPVNRKNQAKDRDSDHHRHVESNQLLRHYERRHKGGHTKNEQHVENVAPDYVAESNIGLTRQRRFDAHGQLGRARAKRHDRQSDDERRHTG